LAGLSSIAILTNVTGLDVQKLGVFPTVEQFATFTCECKNLNFDQALFDPNDPSTHEFGMQFCDLEEFLPSPPNPPMTPNPGYIGDQAAMLCAWETHAGNYGGAIYENYYLGEGCEDSYWSTQVSDSSNEYSWPRGYGPDSRYNAIFNTNIAISRLVVTGEEGFTNETSSSIRGRQSSEGLTIGTATLTRESSTQNETQTDNTINDEGGRTTTDVDGLDTVVLAVRTENQTRLDDLIADSNFETDPTLARMLQVPDIEDPTGGLNELARESASALLNVANPEIKFYYNEEIVVWLTENAADNPHFRLQGIDLLKKYNNLGEWANCP